MKAGRGWPHRAGRRRGRGSMERAWRKHIVDLRRLIPVILVTVVLGVSFSPSSSGRPAGRPRARGFWVPRVTGLVGAGAPAGTVHSVGLVGGHAILPRLTPADYGSGSSEPAPGTQFIAVRTKGDAKDE